jgi:ubiquinone/menaquinone biosynthesis C-methylase UbiE
VVSCETIEHVPDVGSAVREMHRVTRPGGKLFLTTPNYANLTGLYDLYSRGCVILRAKTINRWTAASGFLRCISASIQRDGRLFARMDGALIFRSFRGILRFG